MYRLKAVILSIIFLTGASLKVEAKETKCELVPNKFNEIDFPGLHLSELSILCRTLNNQNDLAALLPGVTHALEAYSRLLVARTSSVLPDISEPEGRKLLDRELVAGLPAKSAKFCSVAQARARELLKPQMVSDLNAACLRPVCISYLGSSSADRSLDIRCGSLRGIDPTKLQRAFELPCSDNPQKRCSASEDAVLIGLAAESLPTWISTLIEKDLKSSLYPNSCDPGSSPALCSDTLRTLVISRVEHISRIFEFARTIAKLPADMLVEKGEQTSIGNFRRHWSAAWGEREEKLTELLDTQDELAPLFLREGLISPAVERAYEAAAAEVESQVKAARSIVVQTFGRRLEHAVRQAAVLENLSGKHSALIDEWKAELNRSAGDPAQMFKTMADFDLKLKDLDHITVEKATIFRKHLEACNNFNELSISTGLYDICIEENGTPSFGIRFEFAPCASTEPSCSTTGRFSLLRRMVKAGEVTFVPEPLGIPDLAGILENGKFIPAVKFNLNRAQAAAAFQAVLPRPYGLTVKDLWVGDGPTITFVVAPPPPFSGAPEPASFELTLSKAGISIGGEIGMANVRRQITNKLRQSLVAQKLEIGAFKVEIDPDSLQLLECTRPEGLAITGSARTSQNQLLLAPDLKLAVDCSGLPSVSVKNPAALAAGIWANVKALLPPSVVGLEPEVADVLIQGRTLSFTATVLNCPLAISTELDTGANLDGLRHSVMKSFVECQARRALGSLRDQIGSLAIQYTDESRTKGCILPALVVCLTSAEPGKSLITANEIIVNDNGYLEAKANALLSSLRPTGTRLVAARDNRGLIIALEMDLKVPVVDRTVKGVQLRLSNDSIALKLDASALTQLAITTISTSLNNDLKGSNTQVGPLRMTLTEIKPLRDGQLHAYGKVSYGGYLDGEVDVTLLPSFRIDAKPPIGIAEALRWLPGIGGSDPQAEVLTDTNGLPAIRVPLTLKPNLFGGLTPQISTTIVAHLDGRMDLGKATVPLLSTWTTVASGIDVGRGEIVVDLNSASAGHFAEIAVNASVAMARGELTSALARLDATLKLDSAKRALNLDGALNIVGKQLGSVKGMLDYGVGRVVIDVGKTEGSMIPLPHGKVVIDGPACASLGQAGYELLGASMSTEVAVLLGGNCKTPQAGPEPIYAKCGSRGPGMICMAGEASLGKIVSADALLKMRFDRLTPLLKAHGTVLGKIDFRADLNQRYVRFGLDILKMLKIGVVLPNVGGLDEDFFKKFLSNLLKFNIDFEALLQGKINIDPSGRSRGADGDSGDDEGSGSSGGDGDEVAAGDQNRVGDIAPGQAPASTQASREWHGRPGIDEPPFKEKVGDGLWAIKHRKGDVSEEIYYPLRFTLEDAARVETGRLTPIPNSLTEFDILNEIFVVACPYPCDLNNAQVMEVVKSETERKIGKDATPIGRLEEYAGELSNNPGIERSAFWKLAARVGVARRYGKNDSPIIVCLKKTDNVCQLLVARILSPVPPQPIEERAAQLRKFCSDNKDAPPSHSHTVEYCLQESIEVICRHVSDISGADKLQACQTERSVAWAPRWFRLEAGLITPFDPESLGQQLLEHLCNSVDSCRRDTLTKIGSLFSDSASQASVLAVASDRLPGTPLPRGILVRWTDGKAYIVDSSQIDRFTMRGSLNLLKHMGSMKIDRPYSAATNQLGALMANLMSAPDQTSVIYGPGVRSDIGVIRYAENGTPAELLLFARTREAGQDVICQRSVPWSGLVNSIKSLLPLAQPEQQGQLTGMIDGSPGWPERILGAVDGNSRPVPLRSFLSHRVECRAFSW